MNISTKFGYYLEHIKGENKSFFHDGGACVPPKPLLNDGFKVRPQSEEKAAQGPIALIWKFVFPTS